MYLKIQGLVLRVTAYNDTDSLITVLTENQGRLTLKARGIRRKNTPLAAPCQLLAYSEFVLFERNGMYSIKEANSIELFSSLRDDLAKLSLATYFGQAAEIVSQEDIANPELLSLVLNCLYALSKLELSCELVKAVFELRLACIAGYTPDLEGCCRCGDPFPDRFDVSRGHLECSGCRGVDSGGIRMPVTGGVLDAFRYICYCDPKRLFSFQTGAETIELLSQLSETYLSSQLERSFGALDFYKSVIAQQ